MVDINLTIVISTVNVSDWNAAAKRYSQPEHTGSLQKVKEKINNSGRWKGKALVKV